MTARYTDAECDGAVEFCRALALEADRRHTAMQSMTDQQAARYVRGLIEAATVAWGVYPAPDTVEGFGVHVIKGGNVRHATITALMVDNPDAVVAIPCADLADVLDVVATCGDSPVALH